MRINVWIALREDFVYPAPDPADDTNQQAKNRARLALAADIAVVPNIFKKRNSAGNDWVLYSLLYEADTWPEIEQAVEAFKSENPGRTDVLGAWDFQDGEQVVDEAVPVYPIPGYLLNFMPDVGDPPVPAVAVNDVNLYFGQASRNFA